MRGIVVMTIAIPFGDADEIERRVELRQLRDPRRWGDRTTAVLAEIGLEEQLHVVQAGICSDSESKGAEMPRRATVCEAEVVSAAGRGRRRSLHEMYLEYL